MATVEETRKAIIDGINKDPKLSASQKTEQVARTEAMWEAEDAAASANKTREGKGTRLSVSSTRGKNPTPVTYESFDENATDTLPESVAEFVSLSGVEDEAQLVSFLITGYNDNSFRIASDPVAEFVNPAWPAEVAASFKIAVKQLIKAGIGDIDAVVAMVRPGVDAKFSK